MNSLLAVGSMAFDTIQTPFGTVEKILGGSVNYFSLAASHFTPLNCVSVVGADFPREHLEVLRKRGINTDGIKIESGATFHWSGKYEFDMNQAHTLATHLNVFESFNPEIPAQYRKCDCLFLGNIAPALQHRVLSQVEKPTFIALDTMNYWIESQRDSLVEVIQKVNAVIVNEGEIRQLTRTQNVLTAARQVQSWGPQLVVVKRGEYGALLFHAEEIFSLPGLPLAEVKDPTGAGDSFAGGFVGYLASLGGRFTKNQLRKAVVFGSVMASFTVQDFGVTELLKASKTAIEERYKRFLHLTSFHEG